MAENSDLLNRLQQHFDEGHTAEAERFLREILESEPDRDLDGQISYLIGRIKYYEGEFEQAESFFQMALRRNAHHDYAKFYVARIWQHLGRKSDALILYAACAKTRPDLVGISDFINEIILGECAPDPENTSPPLGEKTADSPARLPRISIIVLCYNKVEYTDRCLTYLFKNTSYPNYEVIAVDNASVDDTPAFLETFSKRIRFVHSPSNLGFVGGNNKASEYADGEYLVFLNNDTEVQPGWLEHLYECFELYPEAGAVGAKLIYPNYILQEAGGIIFQDGSGWNYGKGNYPHAARFSFAREVDYCSGAALMVRKDLFFKLGKFDPRFAPAYYEDTDLCFSIRKLGYKVMYCPKSEVIHHEGVTAGTDLNSGYKRYQVLNKPKFVHKWQKELQLQHLPDPHSAYLFSNRKKGKRILIIDDWPPLPDRAAGSLRLYHTVKEMIHLGYQVTYAHLIGANLDPAALGHLGHFRMLGVELIHLQYESWWHMRNSKEVKPKLEKLMRSLDFEQRSFDAVYICFWHIATFFIDIIRTLAPNLPIIIDSMDVHYLRELREAEIKNDPDLKKRAMMTRKNELAVYSKADCVTTVTENDRSLLKKSLPDKAIFIMTDVHDSRDSDIPFDERSNLLFVGNFNHNPNEDAAVYFVNEIFPLIRKEIPSVKLLIVGNNPTPRVKNLASDSVIVTGWVPDMKPYLDRCRIEVVPLRYGAGNKGKVAQALANGLPIVMTTIGSEGMNIISGEHAFVCDDPCEFAQRSVELYRDPVLWAQFAKNGKKLVSSMYSSAMMRKRIEYIMSFEDRNSYHSYRALSYPLPPVLSIVLAAVHEESNLAKSLAGIKKHTSVPHEIILAIGPDRAETTGQIKMRHRALRIAVADQPSIASRINRAIVTSLGDYVGIFGLPFTPTEAVMDRYVAIFERTQKDVLALTGQEQVDGPLGILVRKKVLDQIGGFDERFESFGFAAADFIARADLAGFSVERILSDASLQWNCPSSSADSALSAREQDTYRKKWGVAPEVTLRDTHRSSSQNRVYPVNKDEFVECYERALIHISEKEFLLSAIAIERALSKFHACLRDGCRVEYPRVVMLAGKVSLLTGRHDHALRYFDEAFRLTPGDKEIALEYARLLTETRKCHGISAAAQDGQMSNERRCPSLTDARNRVHSDNGDKSREITSLVILTFNELEYTKRCVESIRRHTPEPHEIIFVDNGSTDGTVKWLRKLVEENGHYKLIENRENLGFARGCNQGVEAATGEYVLLLNNDTVVTPDWLSGMLETLTSAPDIGIVGPMTNQISGIQKVEEIGYASLDGLAGYAGAFRERNRHRRIETRRIVGFCMLFRRSLVNRIGMLDESFGTGNFEDDDLCARAALAGYRNVIAGDVFIHHFGSRSFIGNRIDYGMALTGNRRIYADKWRALEQKPEEGGTIRSLIARETAKAHFLRGDVKGAVDLCLEAIRYRPEDLRPYHELAGYLIQAGRFEEALEALEQSPAGTAGAERFVLEGLCREGMKEPEAAASLADRAIAAEESYAPAFNLKGVLAFGRGATEEAKTFFERAAEADPSWGEPVTNLGVLQWAAGQREAALELLEKGFILTPFVSDLAERYHAAAASLGARARAEKVFREARCLHPACRTIAFLLIDLLISQEKHAEAMEEIEAAMAAFEVDGGFIDAALEIRRQLGPMAIGDKTPRPALSLCMIVKNEQSNLVRCLSSVKAAVDEIVVVDTGSTDRTKDLAAVFGARVFDFAWTDDFSSARNVSLSQAKGDWILVLDADETLSPADHRKLRELIRKSPKRIGGYDLSTRNYVIEANTAGWTANDGSYPGEETGTGWYANRKVRLFRNDPRIRFSGAVHELVEASMLGAGMKIATCEIPVHHTGKLDRARVTEKGERYFELGMKKIAETGGTPRAVLELAVQAGELSRWDDAVDLWRRFLGGNPGREAVRAYVNLINACLNADRFDEALSEARKAETLANGTRELLLNCAAAEFFAGDLRKAATMAQRLLQKNPDYPPALGLLAMALALTGQEERGLECMQRLQERGLDTRSQLLPAVAKLRIAERDEQADRLQELIGRHSSQAEGCSGPALDRQLGESCSPTA